MNENMQKLIENTLKDILLGNAVLTFLFAMPMAYIVKHGLTTILWSLTCFIAPAGTVVVVWVIKRVYSHAHAAWDSIWLRSIYVLYALISAELLFVYSLAQIIKNLIK